MSKTRLPGRSGEFFTLLEELRVFRAGPLAGDPADRALAKATGTSPTTIGDWLRGERFPQDIDKVLAVVRIVRDAADRRGVIMLGSGPTGLLDEDRWRAAYQQEAQRRAGVVSGAVKHAQAVWALAGPRMRVGETDLRLLGVHAAISVPGVPDEVPPEYVPRDTDFAEFGVRAKVEAATQRRVRVAGRRVLGREDPLRRRGSEDAAAGVVASASGRAGRSRRSSGRAAAADGGVAG
jgi:hypothetical protein